MVPTRAQALAGKAPPTQCGPTKCAPRPHAIAQAYGRESESRSRIREAGWKSMFLARVFLEARDPPPRDERAQPRCRDRSTLAPVLMQFSLKLVERHHGFSRRYARR